MTDSQGTREELAPATMKFGFRHMIPIARILILRGHLPIDYREDYGFCPTPRGRICHLTHALTDEDWAAVTAQLIIPEHVVYRFGMIRDHENGVQIQGDEIILGDDGEIPIDDWIAGEDWSDLPEDVASAAPGA